MEFLLNFVLINLNSHMWLVPTIVVSADSQTNFCMILQDKYYPIQEGFIKILL